MITIFIISLSSFLYSGITLANLNFSENIPVINDWLIINVRAFIRPGDRNFRRLADMPSLPDDVLYAATLYMFQGPFR